MQKLDYKQFESLQVCSLVHSIYLQCLEATTMLFQAKEGFYFHSNIFSTVNTISGSIYLCNWPKSPYYYLLTSQRTWFQTFSVKGFTKTQL